MVDEGGDPGGGGGAVARGATRNGGPLAFR